MDLSINLQLERLQGDANAPENSEDRIFLFLLNAYRSRRGIARAGEVADLAFYRAGWLPRTVESWIDNGDVFSFCWGDQLWIPLFQFDWGTMTPRRLVRKVCRELRPAFDGWAIARWFVEPNTFVNDNLPVDVVLADPVKVVQAARSDRFIVTG